MAAAVYCLVSSMKGKAMKLSVTTLSCVFLIGSIGAYAATLLEKSFCGIGLQLRPVKGSFVVEKIIPGGGAERAGVPAGSQIVSVDGKPVKGLALQELVNLLRGSEGTVVNLTVAGELGVITTHAITRTQIRAIGPEDLAGTHYLQAEPSVLVVVERVSDNQFRIHCPKQHWSGAGMVGNDCFKGVFQMEDSPEVQETFRGAVSFFRIDFQFGDRLFLRSKFNFFESGDKIVERTLVKKNGRTEPASAGDGR